MEKDKIISLDGIRGVALALVVLVHVDSFYMSIVTPRAWLSYGVPLFYILSGFFITNKIIKKSNYSQSKFLLNRGIALLPAYWISILIVVIFIKPYFILTEDGFKTLIYHFLGWQTFIKGIGGDINGTLWMFGIIFYFYLFISFFATWVKSSKGINLCIFMIVLALIWRAWVFYSFTEASDKVHYGLKFFAPVDNLFVGVLIAIFYQQRKPVFYQLKLSTLFFIQITSLILLVIIQYYFLILHLGDYWDTASSMIVFPTIKAMLLGVFIYTVIRLDETKLMPMLYKFTGLTFLGKISYSAYLFHIPIIVQLSNFTKDNNLNTHFLLLVSVIIIFSSIYQFAVVDKFRKIKF